VIINSPPTLYIYIHSFRCPKKVGTPKYLGKYKFYRKVFQTKVFQTKVISIY